MRKEKNTIKLKNQKKENSMNYDQKINELKINLPKAADPVGSYVAAKISGKMLFISGQISIDEKGKLIKGKIGKDLNTDE